METKNTRTIPNYIAKLGFDKIPLNKEWYNPDELGIYTCKEETREKYEYPDLQEHFSRISPNGLQSLTAALLEWVVCRIEPHYKGVDMPLEIAISHQHPYPEILTELANKIKEGIN